MFGHRVINMQIKFYRQVIANMMSSCFLNNQTKFNNENTNLQIFNYPNYLQGANNN